MFKKSLLTFFLPLIALFGICSAACPVTHVVMTKKLWEHFPHFDNKQKAEFIQGTLLPDIRYMVNIPRCGTHFENVTLDDVFNAPSAFQSGILFHSYVDQQREIFVINSGLYDYIAKYDAPRPATQIKLAEDEFLYSKGDWKAVRASMKKIHPEELKFGIPEVELQKWHVLMDYCFAYSPSTILWYLSVQGYAVMDVDVEEMEVTYELHKQLAQDPVIESHTNNLVEHFDSLFRDWKANNL